MQYEKHEAYSFFVYSGGMEAFGRSRKTQDMGRLSDGRKEKMSRHEKFF